MAAAKPPPAPDPVAALYAALDDTNSTLTIALRDALCESLRAGASLRAACDAAGVDRKTVFRWRARGKAEPATAFGDFYRAVRQARGKGELRYVACIAKAAPDDWRAAAFALKCQYGWRETEAHELSGPKGGPIEHSVAADDDLLERLARAAAGAGRAGGGGEPR